MATKVFLDTNIVIDFIENRDFEREAVHAIFHLAEREEIQVYVSETVITNSLYITKLAEQLNLLMKIVSVFCIKKASIQAALNSVVKDKEDAILYFGALENDMDYFVTRNAKDFKLFLQKRLPVVSAKQFMTMIK